MAKSEATLASLMLAVSRSFRSSCVRGAVVFAPALASLAAQAAAAPVRCLDETGFRVAGCGHWLHTVATEALTLYRVSPKRGDIPRDLIGGVIVHDGFKPYRHLDLRHALCNAHHLRELKALIEFDHELWAEPMRDLLLEANRTVDEARQTGLSCASSPTSTSPSQTTSPNRRCA